MKALIIIGIALTPICLGSAQAADCVSQAMDAVESRSPEQAVGALRKGARKGDERCKFTLGMWSLLGVGMEQDPVSGVRWLSEAAEEGLPAAQANLGVLYARGVGVEKDDGKAARWYRAAAAYGDPLGQASLGAVFFRGVGVPKDRVAAHMWTSLAAAQGNERVRSQLAPMEDAMTADEIAQAKAKAATFRPKQRPRPRRWTRQEVLRAVGIHGPVGEYTRLFGH